MLELPHGLSACHTAVEVNCSCCCCCCCNCPLSAVRVVASTRLALASLRSGLRSVSRHGAHGNSVKDGVEQSAADMNVVCVCVEPVDPPCAMRCPSLHHTSSASPSSVSIVVKSCRRHTCTHTRTCLYYTTSTRETCAGERGRERVTRPSSLVKLAPLWGFCGDFIVCCYVRRRRHYAFALGQLTGHVWTLSHMCGRVGYSKGTEGNVIRHDDNVQTVRKLVDLLLTFLYLLLACLLG